MTDPDDPTVPMRTAQRPPPLQRRTVPAFPEQWPAARRSAYFAALRRRRLAVEVDRHLAEVRDEWQAHRSTQVLDDELARGIGVACLVLGALLILVVVLTGMWLW